MVLDRGIAAFYRTVNTASAGDEPNDTLEMVYQAWYGELDYTSTPRRSAGAQLDIAVDRKIRVIDGPGIIEGAIVKLGSDTYTVIKAWHGHDEESDERIADVEMRLEVHHA